MPESLGQLDRAALQFVLTCAVILAIGSASRLWALRGRHGDRARERRAGLAVWWVLLMVSTVTAGAGVFAAAALFAAVSLRALCEWIPWISRDARDRQMAFALAGALIAAYYGLLAFRRDEAALWFLSVGSLVLIGSVTVMRGRTDGFIRFSGGLYWGMMILVLLPSLIVRLLGQDGVDHAVGWYLYVMILTPFSDICQALVGRRWGQHKITPTVSPHKSWEGLIGGIVAVTIASVLVSPLLTPWNWWPATNTDVVAWRDLGAAALFGAVFCVIGFFGDIHLSAVKRDVGVKDSANWLPGQGGMIDRIDSLTFTGALTYFVAVYLA